MRYFLAVMFVLVMILSLASCGNNGDGTDKKETENVENISENTNTDNETEEKEEYPKYENLSPAEVMETFLSVPNAVYTQNTKKVDSNDPEEIRTSVGIIKHRGSLVENGFIEGNESYTVYEYYDFDKAVQYRNEYGKWYDYSIDDSPSWETYVNGPAEIKSDMGALFVDEYYDKNEDGSYTWNNPESISNFYFKPSQIKSVTMTSEGNKYVFTIEAETSRDIFYSEIIIEFTPVSVNIPADVIENVK